MTAHSEAKPSDTALSEDTFWALASGGITALAHGNTWAANARLAAIIEQLKRADADDADIGSADRWRGAVARRRADLGPARAATAQAYTTLIEDYRRRHQQSAGPNQSPSDAATCETLLASLQQAVPSAAESAPPITLTSLSVALPAYNEEANIATTVASCVETLSAICPHFEVIIVDDGSRDRTGEIGDELARADASVRCVHNGVNKGYGGALRAGFDSARGDWLFFMDSDGQFDIRDITRFLEEEREKPGLIVLGYRAQRSDRFMRKVNAWGWKLATRALIGLHGIRDIDCAFKLFPTKTIRACDLQSTGATVSAEFLVKFQRMGAPIVQFPVKHLPRRLGSPTGAKVSVILRAFKELLALRKSLGQWQAPVQRPAYNSPVMRRPLEAKRI